MFFNDLSRYKYSPPIYYKYFMEQYPWQLYHWHVEVSSKCALKCPRCPRVESSKLTWTNSEITLDQFKQVFTTSLLEHVVQRITFCGDVGDPIYASEFLDIVEYIKTTNQKTHIYIITNGSYKNKEWWVKLAAILNEYDTINFSVDGYDHTSNIKYRINSDWSSIMEGMSIMCHKSSAIVNWASIVFSFNEAHLDLIKKLATDIGCDGFQLTMSTKFGSLSPNLYGDRDPLEPSPAFLPKTNKYKRQLIQLSNKSQVTDTFLKDCVHNFDLITTTYNNYITPICLIGNRGLFLSSTGIVYPCCWTSFPFNELSTTRKSITFAERFHQKYQNQLNAFQRPLIDVLSDPIWNKLFESFNDKNKAWVECEQKCQWSTINFEYVFGYHK